jgi:uncharacterized membrane protein YidH (DUF202 family)
MTSSEIPPQSKDLEEVALWIVIGLCLALGVAWETYPRIYIHYHPVLPWPGYPGNWDSYGPSNGQLSFFFAFLVAAVGFGQLRFSRWFQRDISKSLLRTFLLAVFVMVAGLWTIALANHFWTIEHNNELRRAEPYMDAGAMLFRIGFWSALVTALSNTVYAVVRKRRV